MVKALDLSSNGQMSASSIKARIIAIQSYPGEGFGAPKNGVSN